ncbi:GGDEF domain-containing protein [Dyella sp. 2HG41-7]|uniref:tetratricopeptide repeat-containing diguanylate cyclase n=1 Tax=Dyella sp. 2HG41-7 TaxID=2883239 RepID=UPI001F463918|nr:GGDEF domain-containing protein [Dyella sp. 2HG41-7]
MLLGFALRAASAGTPAQEETAQLFVRADDIEVVDNAAFAKLLIQIESREASLSDAQRWHLRYLEAWQSGYLGQIDKAKPMLELVIAQAPDIDLKEQARGTLINVLGIGHHYEEAFRYLDQALDALPRVTVLRTRLRILFDASQLLTEAAQYDLASNYADQILTTKGAGYYRCLGIEVKLAAEFGSGKQTSTLIPQVNDGVSQCQADHDLLSADTIQLYRAKIDLQQGNVEDAIALLQDHYAEVQHVGYVNLISQFQALLAEAYWRQGDGRQAEKFAQITVDTAGKSGFSEPLIKAYQLLYQIARQKGDMREAIAYHEKYILADNSHLDDLREKAYAYQIVKQQVEAKKAELDALDRRNQILQLQQSLDRKAMVTSRLYIALLLTVLASIAFWLYRLKRSQLRFMQLARRDGLTGIFNRQHFVSEAEQSLRYARKSQRVACLVLFDLDHFKNINDAYGHASGDNVLKRAVAICHKHLHSFDVFGRLGGEEFGVLLAEATLVQALERAEGIRLAIQASEYHETERVPVSASFGIACTADYGYDLRGLLIAADSALYRAKREGRNRVVVSVNECPRATSVRRDASEQGAMGASPNANPTK